MSKKEFFKLTPFKMQVLQSFPFIDADFDALTNYELLCKVVEYLNITVDNVNLLNDDFKTLYNYVHDYFDNLDVQEEINNKLDEMAESGELSDIIAQYLGLAGVLSFDTVSSMKSATNLVNGSTAHTLGYHSLNDGGKAFYKIRTITNDDVVDESFIIALNDNTLIAELIYDEINIKQLGAYGDDTHDDTLIIQKALNKGKSVFIPYGTYKITNTLTMGDTYLIYGIDPHLTKIKSYDADKDIIQLKTANTYNITIKNLGILHETIGNGNGIVFGNDGVWQLNKIANCRFTNNNIAIYVKENTGSLYSSEISNCEIFNFNRAGIELLNKGSSGNIYDNIYVHNNDRSSTYGIHFKTEDNLSARNLNIEWGTYTDAPFYATQTNGVIENLHFEGVNSRTAIHVASQVQLLINDIFFNFVNNEYSLAYMSPNNVLLEIGNIKFVNNEESQHTLKTFLYNDTNNIKENTRLNVEHMVVPNNITINNNNVRYGSHFIPEKYNNKVFSVKRDEFWEAIITTQSAYYDNIKGNSIEYINGKVVDGKFCHKAICIANGVSSDTLFSANASVTQYQSYIQYPKTAGSLSSGIALKINDQVVYTTGSSYSYDADNNRVSISANISSATGTYNLYKTTAIYEYV